jgi:putative membrane protein
LPSADAINANQGTRSNKNSRTINARGYTPEPHRVTSVLAERLDLPSSSPGGIAGFSAGWALRKSGMGYLWLKAVHVIAIIAWMAGMLYLPRLFVYHAQSARGSEQSATFKIMERRLLRAIMTPSMMIVWITGLWLAIWSGSFQFGWLHTKILLVLAMSGIHGYLAVCVKKFAADQNQKDGKFYRIINEIPTVLLIGIVILVVVKPF